MYVPYFSFKDLDSLNFTIPLSLTVKLALKVETRLSDWFDLFRFNHQSSECQLYVWDKTLSRYQSLQRLDDSIFGVKHLLNSPRKLAIVVELGKDRWRSWTFVNISLSTHPRSTSADVGRAATVVILSTSRRWEVTSKRVTPIVREDRACPGKATTLRL